MHQVGKLAPLQRPATHTRAARACVLRWVAQHRDACVPACCPGCEADLPTSQTPSAVPLAPFPAAKPCPSSLTPCPLSAPRPTELQVRTCQANRRHARAGTPPALLLEVFFPTGGCSPPAPLHAPKGRQRVCRELLPTRLRVSVTRASLGTSPLPSYVLVTSFTPTDRHVHHGTTPLAARSSCPRAAARRSRTRTPWRCRWWWWGSPGGSG